MSPEERQMCARIVASVMFAGINYKSPSVHGYMHRERDGQRRCIPFSDNTILGILLVSAHRLVGLR